MEWFDRLKELKEFVEGAADTGADWLRVAAEFSDKFASALRDAATAIDPTPTRMGTAAAKPLGAVHAADLEEFKAECEEAKGAVGFGADPTAAGGSWQVLLLDLLIRGIEEILRRRKQ